jgi:type II secretory pathway component PulK
MKIRNSKSEIRIGCIAPPAGEDWKAPESESNSRPARQILRISDFEFRISRASGSVLILALWALLLLSAAIFAWLKFIDLNIAVTGQRNNGLTAKALAHSGVMVALHPQVTRQTPLLDQQLAPDRGYKVQMTGEGGRLNLNWIFSPAQNPDPGKISLFQRYLQLRGLNIQQQERLTDCILDWLTPGNVPRLNGAKADGDYQPPGRGAFLSVDELALVKGSQPLVSQAGWQDDFTIYTNPGLIDLQSASQRILDCLPGVGDANATRFLQVRRGPDGADGTADDHLFADANEAISYLGVNSRQAQLLAPYVYVENPLVTVHILSTGQCGNVYRHVEVVAKKMGMQPIILSWKEL